MPCSLHCLMTVADTPANLLHSSHHVAPPSNNHRSERLAKYNQLLRIEQELGSDAVYAGENWRFIGY